MAGVLLASTAGCSMDDPADELSWGEITQKVGAFGGFVVVSGDDADDSGHCQGTRCGGMYPKFLSEAVQYSRSGGTGILAIGVNSSFALSSLDGWNSPSNGGPGAPMTHVQSTSEIQNVDFNDYAVIYLPSSDRQTSGGIRDDQLAALATRQPDIAAFVNDRGGSLIALTQAGARNAWSFLPMPLTTVNPPQFTYAKPTAELLAIAPEVTRDNLSHCCFHNVFTGPVDGDGLYQGLKVLAVHDEPGMTGYGQPVILGGRNIVLTAEDCTDGIDNDGDGLIDKEDPDCWRCGDGIVDPNEECDDGNLDSGDGCSSTCIIENLPPVAVCQDASVCNATGQCYASVTGLGDDSYDPDGDPISIVQSPAGPYAVGQHQISIRVSDGQSEDQCFSDLEVRDCEAPAIDCAPDFRVECTGNGGANVTAPGASATDNCGVASVTDPSGGHMALGAHALSYTATDHAGNTASCATTVTVQDTTPPAITCPAPSLAECTGNGQAPVDPGQAQASDSCTSAIVNVPGTGSYPLGTTSVLYTAVDLSANQASCTTTVTVQDTTPPVIACPAPSVVECTGNGQAPADPGQAQASDSCTSATVSVPGTDSYPLGTSDVHYTAVDQAGNQASCTTTITVQDTTPPAIDCPAPIVVECTGNSSAHVIPGEATADDVCTEATVAGPSAGSYPLGTTEVTYTATDLAGNQSTCTSTIQVVDTTPAEVIVNPPQPLWPPNHKYATIDLLADCGVQVVDQCGGVLDPSITAPTITCVTSDEPENIISDGNTTDDIVIVDATTVKLRAERQGKGDGRVYHIHFQVQDAAGNVTEGVCPVGVPHDQRPGASIVDSGVAYQVCR